MRYNYAIRSVSDKIDLKILEKFVLGQPLNYPFYEDWAIRAMSEIDSGYKKSIVVFDNDCLVGEIIYQPDKKITNFREIKNLRIHPKSRNLGLARLLVKLAEKDSSENIEAMIVDTHENQKDVQLLLISLGYSPVISSSLYNPNQNEIVMFKPLKQNIEYEDKIYSSISGNKI